MRKNLLLPSLILLGSLALTAACAGGPSGTESGQGGATASSGPAIDDQGIDPAKINGLDIVTDSSEHGSCPYATSYPAVPGADAMAAAMRKDVQQRLATFLGTNDGAQATDCGGGSGSRSGQELNISHQFLIASGDVLGVRLSTLDRGAAGDGLATRTYWYDGAAKAYRTPPGLVADGARESFIAALKKDLEGQEGVDAGQLDEVFGDPAAQTAVLDDVAFGTDGGMRVSFDRGDVGVPAGGRYAVAFSKETITPWLSAFGKRAQQQAMHPSGTLDLGATGAPEEPVPTHRASGEDTTDCTKVKCVALTFDDGPAVPEAATLLNHLAQYKARVTFFTVGQNVAAHPELVRAEAKAGHEVGNHSWNHPDLTRLTPEQIRYQLNRTSEAIKNATGEAPTLFRPPYGAMDAKVKAATTLSPVLWDVDTEDWKYRDAAKVAQTVIAKTEPNDVVLMHDIHPTSVAAVPEILRTLTARGYHFVTVSHLRTTLAPR
ncbi:polysaccharide deacetylase family protein [Streptomyces sp. DSM 40750]|uniref:polysaccharide deacetylase family protein n=1 Tax=Streptomyces sp. DSM 40750 TaxID=2801030 RepID=UPI00214B0F7C|nr:polysaccharide deacetylase family protein [Streptomyces sp. DSM 40750]UUU19471.1 polysaccharide deacetylase family protein [Streptomyces sp. DSM 40750]UUU27185.1 polysaccharide deacetylase family protein [Streptomyces sp. DSM 40750]